MKMNDSWDTKLIGVVNSDSATLPYFDRRPEETSPHNPKLPSFSLVPAQRRTRAGRCRMCRLWCRSDWGEAPVEPAECSGNEAWADIVTVVPCRRRSAHARLAHRHSSPAILVESSVAGALSQPSSQTIRWVRVTFVVATFIRSAKFGVHALMLNEVLPRLKLYISTVRRCNFRKDWMTFVWLVVATVLVPANSRAQWKTRSGVQGPKGPNIGVIWIRTTPSAMSGRNGLPSTFKMRRKLPPRHTIRIQEQPAQIFN